jgi:tetratricopeptide (TPR) repeat protein
MIKITSIAKVAAIAVLIAFSPSAEAQQLKTPAPSPTQTIDQAFALSNIKIEYSRPGVKGRKVFGDLVPFGKIWRTGANASTKITFGDSVKVEGNIIKPGTYALYTIPNADSWTIMFYKDLALGSVADYKTEDEVLRVKVKPSALPQKVETFTINIADVTATSASVELLWENTRAAFNVTTDIDDKVMKNIEAALEKDSRPYFSAANYYYENNKDLKKALEWVEIAWSQNPKAYYMAHLKAKIQMKMKDTKGAIETAEKSLALSREAKSDDYIRLNEKLIAEAKGQK